MEAKWAWQGMLETLQSDHVQYCHWKLELALDYSPSRALIGDKHSIQLPATTVSAQTKDTLGDDLREGEEQAKRNRRLLEALSREEALLKSLLQQHQTLQFSKHADLNLLYVHQPNLHFESPFLKIGGWHVTQGATTR